MFDGGWVIFYKASLCVLQLEGKLYNKYGGGEGKVDNNWY